jgi:hypothetical protein
MACGNGLENFKRFVLADVLRLGTSRAPGKSGGGPPQSKTLARWPMTIALRAAFWSAPVLWRFEKTGLSPGRLELQFQQP